MAGFIKNIFNICLIAVVAPTLAFGASSPRAASSKVLTRSQSTDSNAAIRRSATSVIARSTSVNSRRSKTVVTARPAISRNVKSTSVRSGGRVVSNGANLSRAAVANKSGVVRSATSKGKESTSSHLSRAATSRATAVFNDITKIGGGYSNCRDAYATCMDQFCASANDVYRRCFCSDRFKKYREMSDNMDTAIGMLNDFSMNNLEAVDKSADEVDAMYSATEGELAIRKDTSEAQKTLNEITDLLSGKTTSSGSKSDISSSLGLIGLGDFSDLGDIWSDFGSSSSVFSRRNSDDISELEGVALYQRASNQCAAITRESCSSDTMFDLASSAYSVMITQDCNAFGQVIDSKKIKLENKVREAEKLLRDARLEDFRAHNSKDFNDCLTKVEDAVAVVCGSGLERCLDYTGNYLSATTGEPLLKNNVDFFQITKIAPDLVTEGDLLAANPIWNSKLESYKDNAETALDGCRSIAPQVWDEFKRMALIRIAQGQDEKVQEAKDSCVSVIKDCYDTQLGALKIDDDSNYSMYNANAEAVVTARGACYDQVATCAALYGGDPDGCVYNKSTKKLEAAGNGKVCGLQALLNYVDVSDAAKVATECEATLSAKAYELCNKSGCLVGPLGNTLYQYSNPDMGCISGAYPNGCLTKTAAEVRSTLVNHAKQFCALDSVKHDTTNTLRASEESAFSTDIVNNVIKSIFDELGLAFTLGCEDEGGEWWGVEALTSAILGSLTENDLSKSFYDKYYGGTSLTSILSSIKLRDIGACVDMTANKYCSQIGGTLSGDYCDLTNTNRYSMMCEWLDDDRTFQNDKCTVKLTEVSRSKANFITSKQQQATKWKFGGN